MSVDVRDHIRPKLLVEFFKPRGHTPNRLKLFRCISQHSLQESLFPGTLSLFRIVHSYVIRIFFYISNMLGKCKRL